VDWRLSLSDGLYRINDVDKRQHDVGRAFRDRAAHRGRRRPAQDAARADARMRLSIPFGGGLTRRRTMRHKPIGAAPARTRRSIISQEPR
jgi:hypothetical protein